MMRGIRIQDEENIEKEGNRITYGPSKRAKTTRSEVDHTKIYKEMEHARTKRPQKGTIKWAE